MDWNFLDLNQGKRVLLYSGVRHLGGQMVQNPHRGSIETTTIGKTYPTLYNIYFRQANMEQFIDTLASDESNPGEWDPKAVYDKLPEIQGMTKLWFL